MKVLHLLNTGKFSGAENVVCQIVDLIRDDIDFVYCSLDGSIGDVLFQRGIVFAPIKRMCVSEIKRVIREQKPDVIHAHDMRASFYAALSCGKIPLVCHVHNNAYDSRKINLKSVLFCIAAFKARHIFWVSDTSFSGYIFHHFFKKKSSVLLNVINISKLYQKMDEDVNSYSYDIAFVGRLTFQKNPERLIEIFRKLSLIKPNFRACVLGDGPLMPITENLVRTLHLEANVDLLGFQKNPYKRLFCSKTMLLVSRWEGLPMCVLEALALGIPVVSTPTDGLNAVVKNGINGFISNSDEEIVTELKNILDDESKLISLKENAKKLSLEFNDLSRYKENICQVYTSI